MSTWRMLKNSIELLFRRKRKRWGEGEGGRKEGGKGRNEEAAIFFFPSNLVAWAF